MNIDGKHYRTIWPKNEDAGVVRIIDQRHLPFSFIVEDLASVDDVAIAIKDMHVRGAGLIGATAGFGMAIAARRAPRTTPAAFRDAVAADAALLKATRPTAVNLAWAVDRQLAAMSVAGQDIDAMIAAAEQTARTIADEDAGFCQAIGRHGVALIAEISRRKGGAPVNVLTHCNAGWLAFVDFGSATAPIYAAHDAGLAVHVWVDETRPRNQGARLTAWELGQHGVPHTVIVDNAGGHLMQHGMIDLVIVGSDRTTCTGDVANKIGTYLKALAAHDNGIPFFVALPSSSIDWVMCDGVAEIPIEQRDELEVRVMDGMGEDGVCGIRILPDSSPAANFAFDVTPSRLVTGLITERGICAASAAGLAGLFPDMVAPPAETLL